MVKEVFTMTKITKKLLCIAMSTILLAGCTGSSSANGKITLEFFSLKAENIDIYQELIKEFEAKHPNIHVDLEQPPEAETVLRMKLTKNDTPDNIGFYGYPNFGGIGGGWVLHGFLGLGLVGKVQAKFFDMVDRLVGPERDGVYGLPYATNADVVIYNK